MTLPAPAPGPAAPDEASRRSRDAAVLLVAALAALGLAWELVLAPTGRGTLALKVAPLLLALPGLLRYRLSTFRWLSLLVWLYVFEGSTRMVTDAGLSAVLAVLELLMAVALFVACGWHVRHRLRASRADPALPADGPR